MSQKLVIRDLGGQRCSVVISQRDNGSTYVTFKSEQGYGFPSLELEELEDLIVAARQMVKIRKYA